MAKFRLKLAHVKPHAWFCMLKDRSKTGSHSYKKSSQSKVETQHKVGGAIRRYGSPVNHKGHFPDTPKKSPVKGRAESPINEHIEGHGLYNNSNIIAAQPPTSLKTHHSNMPHEAPPHRNSSLKTSKEMGFHLNVHELEIKLKALSSQVRRKYYSSPIFSAALLSPILDGGSQDDLNLDLLESSSNYPFEEHTRRFANKFVHEEFKPITQGGRSSKEHTRRFANKIVMPINQRGRSSNNSSTSFRQSTSYSSDTGFDIRASSFIWERDLSALTTEGSDLFTTIEDIDNNSLLQLQRSSRVQKGTQSSPKKGKNKFLNAIKDTHGHFICSNDDTSCSNGMCSCKGHGEVPKNLSRYQSESNVGLRENYLETQLAQALIQNMQKHKECRFLLLQNEGEDYQEHRRVSSNEFSCTESKDRLLCGRLTFDQCSNSAFSESELKTASKNYRRFKLQQRSGKLMHANSKLNFSNANEANLNNSPIYKNVYLEKNPLLSKSSSRSSLADANPICYPSLSKSASRSWSSDANLCDCHNNPYDYPSLSKSANRRLSDANPCDYHNNPSLPKSSRRSLDGDYHENDRMIKHHPCYYNYHIKPSLSKSSSSRNIKDNQCCCCKGRGVKSKDGTECGDGTEGTSWCKGSLRVAQEKAEKASDAPFNGASKVYDSFAMVKRSYDPRQDFKESMMEMILGKELHNSSDLVELLQCFLTLNSEQYHDTIVKVFSEVWCELFSPLELVRGC